VEREGHENLNDEQAMEHINKLVHKHENLMEKGYSNFSPADSERHKSARNLNPISFRILHLILHSPIYGLKATNVISE
jgi:hypothetical protein